ncbi:thioredoxin-1, putative [Entamoeba invadens IP1]|uniref:Thioredoxin n=1 Tax=Entamoeba invadens IP1 TaxID=370355 RepID=A0A0A1U843_ENTIV|nr:thioredoxin-1, putative [Entamoeba invadens IP1]ELP90996.1 thioredoxin-1, putative [Entamoeba invadens IP1]|eukprot:XP_004257767.1 thioredoxin-1, putative [Entamoeba invadens IP1]
MEIENVETIEQLEKALSKNENVIIEFSTAWCHPCKTMDPVYKKISTEHVTIKFLKVNVDKGQKLVERYEIMAMPTFILIKDKIEIGRFSGTNKSILLEMINNI